MNENLEPELIKIMQHTNMHMFKDNIATTFIFFSYRTRHIELNICMHC